MVRDRGGERPARSKTMETTGLGGTTEGDIQTSGFLALSDFAMARQLEENMPMDDGLFQKEMKLIQTELQGKYDNKLKQVQEEHKRNVDRLEGDMKILRKINHRLHDQFSEVENQNEGLRAQIEELHTQLSEVDTLRSRIRELYTQLSEVDALRAQIKDLQAQLSQEDDVNNKWENELDSRVYDLEATHAKQIDELKKSNAQFIDKYEHANGVLQDQLLQIGPRLQNSEDLQAELEETKAKLKAAEKTISNMHELQVSTLQEANDAVLESRRSFDPHVRSVECPRDYPVVATSICPIHVPFNDPDKDERFSGGGVLCMVIMHVLAVQDLDCALPVFGSQCAHPFGQMNKSGDSTQQNRVPVMEVFILLEQQALRLYSLIQRRQFNNNKSFDVMEISTEISKFKQEAVAFIIAKGWNEADIQLEWDDLVHLLLTLVGYNQSFVNSVKGSQYPKVTPWSKALRNLLLTEVNPVVSRSGQQDPLHGGYIWRAELEVPDTISVLAPSDDDDLQGLQYSVRIETPARCWVMTFVTISHLDHIYIIKVGHKGNGIYTLRHPTREEDVFLSPDGKLVVDGNRNIGGCNENSGLTFKAAVYTVVPQDYINPY